MAGQSMSMGVRKPNPGNSLKIILLGLGGMVIGLGFGYAIGRMLKGTGPAASPAGWTLLLLPVAGMLAIALHEAGHVVAGLLCGFRFSLYVVGPLRIDMERGRLKSSFNRALSLAGGIAACTPQSYGPDLRVKALVYAAGGPVFSILGAAALLTRPANANTGFVLIMFGIISAAIAVGTLIPVTVSGHTSDGGRVLMLLRDRIEARRWVAMGVIARLISTERPKDWPAGLLDLLGEGVDDTPDAASVCLVRHWRHMDLGHLDLARMWLERGLAKIDCLSSTTRGALYISAANLEAWRKGNAALGRRYLEQARKTAIFKTQDLYTVSAAVLVAEGRREEALAELELASLALKTKNQRAGAPEREEIEELRARLN